MHTQESIALAAGLLGQAKGDIAAARRAAGEAHAWLCSIDASYKGEAKPAPVSDETRQRLDGKRDTAWGALSAVTFFTSWQAPVKGDDAAASRWYNATLGDGADLADAALQRLTVWAGA